MQWVWLYNRNWGEKLEMSLCFSHNALHFHSIMQNSLTHIILFLSWMVQIRYRRVDFNSTGTSKACTYSTKIQVLHSNLVLPDKLSFGLAHQTGILKCDTTMKNEWSKTWQSFSLVRSSENLCTALWHTDCIASVKLVKIMIQEMYLGWCDTVKGTQETQTPTKLEVSSSWLNQFPPSGLIIILWKQTPCKI